jgi:hypothetical protein
MAAIEIRIRTLAQLFDSLDPSPFHERALDPKAEDYILASARERHGHERIELLIHAPEALEGHVSNVAASVHAHFRLALETATRRFRQRMRIGRWTLAIGLAVLAICLALRAVVPAEPAWLEAVREGLLILGWVSLWRPVEILLFERWESAQERALLARLAAVPVAFAYFREPGAGD